MDENSSIKTNNEILSQNKSDNNVEIKATIENINPKKHKTAMLIYGIIVGLILFFISNNTAQLFLHFANTEPIKLIALIVTIALLILVKNRYFFLGVVLGYTLPPLLLLGSCLLVIPISLLSH
jgi:hypothetical protein